MSPQRSAKRRAQWIPIDEPGDDPVALAAFADAERRHTLARSMREQRKSAKRSQQQVADEMGTTQSAVSDLESGKVEPQIGTLQRYARAIRRRYDFAIVDPRLPVYDERTAADYAKFARERATGPLLLRLAVGGDPQSRSLGALATAVGLPDSVVLAILNLLESSGWVTSSDGVYEITSHAPVFVGTSLHSDRVETVVSDMWQQVLHRDVSPLSSTKPDDVAATAARAVADLRKRVDRDVFGVGVSVSGHIDASTGTVLFGPDLPLGDGRWWQQVPLAAGLGDALAGLDEAFSEVPIHVDNDANALAVHEYLLGGAQSVAVVLLSETGGIGCGAVADGHVIRGAHHAAGEPGHIVVAPGGRRCRTGLHEGCLETVATAPAIIAALASEKAGGAAATQTSVQELRKLLKRAAARVDREDEAAIDAFRKAGEYLGSYLPMLLAIVDPGRFVIYGQPELVDAERFTSAAEFRNSAEQTLRGFHKGHYFNTPDVDWKVLQDDTDARAAASAVERAVLRRPFSAQEDAAPRPTLDQ